MKPREETRGRKAEQGKVQLPAKAAGKPDLAAIYRDAVRSRVLDGCFEAWTRAGLLGFALPALEWGGVLAAATAALQPADWLFPSARESRMAVWRGMPLEIYLAQHLGRELSGDGPKILPAFPGAVADAARRVASVPGGPASHLPQAVGAAQAMKLRKESAAVLAFCSGAAVDEPDFHVALNFAGVWQAPVLVCVRLEPDEQRGFDVAARGAAYGLEGLAVDGAELDALATDLAGALVEGKPRLVAVRKPGAEDGGLASLRRRLGNGSRPDDAALSREAERWCDAALASARAAHLPAPATLADGVYAVPPPALGEELAAALGGPVIPEDA
ncbi:MAG TPA: thiamine pyrophosphate-dependent enzyme [Myxococcales bacterium]|nr:thiamine pyrophosphate-dependent enzyme [Myxococcales bacterium]